MWFNPQYSTGEIVITTLRTSRGPRIRMSSPIFAYLCVCVRREIIADLAQRERERERGERERERERERELLLPDDASHKCTRIHYTLHVYRRKNHRLKTSVAHGKLLFGAAAVKCNL